MDPDYMKTLEKIKADHKGKMFLLWRHHDDRHQDKLIVANDGPELYRYRSATWGTAPGETLGPFCINQLEAYIKGFNTKVRNKKIRDRMVRRGQIMKAREFVFPINVVDISYDE